MPPPYYDSRSGRLNAINGQDRRCNRIGVPPRANGALRLGGWLFVLDWLSRARVDASPRRRGRGVSYVFIYSTIDSRYPITETTLHSLAFKISSFWKHYTDPPIISPFIYWRSVYDRVEFMYETPSFFLSSIHGNVRDSVVRSDSIRPRSPRETEGPRAGDPQKCQRHGPLHRFSAIERARLIAKNKENLANNTCRDGS